MLSCCLVSLHFLCHNLNLSPVQRNPLVKRVIEILDEDGNGEVDFKEFIQGVSQFSVKGDKMSKLKFAFKIYDIDNDGYISNGELFQGQNSIEFFCESVGLTNSFRIPIYFKIQCMSNISNFELF